jgi:hypothetical protein
MKFGRTDIHKSRKLEKPIAIKDPRFSYTLRHHLLQVDVSDQVTVEVTINEEAICKFMLHRAAATKAGKAKFMDGMITAKVVAKKEIEHNEKEVPIPEGYEEVRNG